MMVKKRENGPPTSQDPDGGTVSAQTCQHTDNGTSCPDPVLTGQEYCVKHLGEILHQSVQTFMQYQQALLADIDRFTHHHEPRTMNEDQLTYLAEQIRLLKSTTDILGKLFPQDRPVTMAIEELQIRELQTVDIDPEFVRTFALLADACRESLSTLVIDTDKQLGVTSKNKRKRAETYTPLALIDLPGRMPTHSPLNIAIAHTYFSELASWQYTDHIGSYFLETPNGRTIADHISTVEDLQRLLSLVGAEGLQYACAALIGYTAAQKAKHGRLPDYKDCTPVTIHAAELLRAMGRKPRGKHGGYSREEQMNARRYLKAASVFNFVNISPTSKGKARMTVGPLFMVTGTEAEISLPLEGMDVYGDDDVISFTIIPGPGFWNLLCEGVHWLTPQLLQYHPIRDKYAIAVGFYLSNMMMIRRNKEQDGDSISLGTIEREAKIDTFDKRPTVRMEKLEEALHKLVRDGVIGGFNGRAVIADDPTAGAKTTADAMRARRMKLIAPPTMLQAMKGQRTAFADQKK